MTFRIVKDIPRSPEDRNICSELAHFGVATVAESQDKTNVMDPAIRPIQAGKSIAGTAVTVRCADADNLMIHAAIEYCKPGDVLVVSTMSETRNGYFGELLAIACKRRGVVGLIIDGGVRDTKKLREIDFPVWSRYVCVTGTSKNRPGWINVPITCGNVTVNPGDFITADDDGVVVTPRDIIFDVLRKAREREEKENDVRRKIEDGELSVDLYSFRKVIEQLGIKIENLEGDGGNKK